MTAISPPQGLGREEPFPRSMRKTDSLRTDPRIEKLVEKTVVFLFRACVAAARAADCLTARSFGASRGPAYNPRTTGALAMTDS